jgi:NADH dehydrogenase [ubiquinone] 1 alpha subcomplex assembly factor 1
MPCFAGHVSVENNGGFASVRCQPCDFGRKEVIAYLLEVRGDGKRYKLNLRTDERF